MEGEPNSPVELVVPPNNEVPVEGVLLPKSEAPVVAGAVLPKRVELVGALLLNRDVPFSSNE